MNEAQGSSRAQLAVGDVEEVGAADQQAQGLPGIGVGAGVGSIAIGDFELNGHLFVGDGEDPQKLLQIGAVILVVPEGDLQCGMAAYGGAIGCGVLSVEGEGGGVVVQLLEGDVELLDHVQNELGEHGAAVGVEESVEGSADTVVVELAELSGGAAQKRWKKCGGPFDDGIQGASTEDEALQECGEGDGGVELGTRIGRGEVAGEDLGEAQAGEELIDDGKGGDGGGVQRERHG